MRIRYASLIVACCLVVVCFACSKKVQTTPKGPGGLPTGIVQSNAPPLEEKQNYPIYEGAKQRAVGVYETTDPITKVKEYYINLLGIQPVSKDLEKRTFTFETAEFTLVLLPLDGGTEIRFEPPRKDR